MDATDLLNATTPMYTLHRANVTMGTLPPTSFEYQQSAVDSSLLQNLITPFFLIASILFLFALVYSLTFLCILRFGTFVPEYNARYFRGRIYFCYGQTPCFGLCGHCNWCYIPLCWCVQLHPVSEDRAFSRALEGGGLSREERREALLELLDPMCHIACRSRGGDKNGEVSSLDVVVPEEQIVHHCQNAIKSNEIPVACVEKHIMEVLKEAGAEDDEESIVFEPIAPNNDKENDHALFVVNDETKPEELAEDSYSDVASSTCSLGFDPTCSICLCEYEHGSIYVQSSVCPHRFHRDCLLEWLEVQNNTQCPCCRKDVITNQQVRETARRLRQEKRGSSNPLGLLSTWFDVDREDVGGRREDLFPGRLNRTQSGGSSEVAVASAPVSNTIERDLEFGTGIMARI